MSAPACVCAVRGYCADVPGDPLACPVCVHLVGDEPCPHDGGTATHGLDRMTPAEAYAAGWDDGYDACREDVSQIDARLAARLPDRCTAEKLGA